MPEEHTELLHGALYLKQTAESCVDGAEQLQRVDVERQVGRVEVEIKLI
jgi:hypothetical protein